jgi:hypothetical protein
MNIREALDIIEPNNEIPTDKTENIYEVIGDDIKSLLKLINLEAIDNIDLAQHIMGTIDRVYIRQGVPQPISIASMYGIDKREAELDLAKKAAEVNKIKAQATKISAERSAKQ